MIRPACRTVALAIIAAALVAPVARGQVLLSDTFDRADSQNTGSFNNALGGTLASGTYFKNTTSGSTFDVNIASIGSNALLWQSGNGPGKVTPNQALGTADFSITTRASSTLTNPSVSGTYANLWLLQLRAPSFNLNYGAGASGLSALTGQVDVMMAPNGQVFVRSWSGGTATALYNANPFTGATAAGDWKVGAADSLPASINGFAFDTDGDGNIDDDESFLFGATISGSTLNVLVNGTSIFSGTVSVAAPATNYAVLARQRQANTAGLLTVVPEYDNLVIAAAATDSSLAGTAASGFRVLQNGTATTTLTLTNSGNQATAFDLGLANASGLAVTGSTVGTVAASGSTAISLAYASTATVGVRSGTVTIANLGTTTDLPAAVSVSGTVYEAASLTKVQSGTVGGGGTVSLSNAAGAFRAGGSIASRSVTGDGGWSVAGLAQGDAIAAGATAGGTASFDSVGKLNGTYLGTFALDLQNDQSIQGATAGDLGSMDWSLSQTVSGNVGSGTAALAAGRSLAGFSGQSALQLATEATLLDGQTTAATTVSMAFAARPEGSYYSDVLQLQGTGGLAQVLQLSFNPGSLGGTAEGSLMLGWKNGSNEWVNAVLGNTGGNPGYTGTAFLGSWDEYLAAGEGRTVANSLGAYGIDTDADVVWAAINHNSEFVVIVPEPGAIGLAGIGIAATGLAFLRRRVRVAI